MRFRVIYYIATSTVLNIEMKRQERSRIFPSLAAFIAPQK